MALLRDQKYKDSLNSWSSFLSVEKTLEEVVGLIMHNDRLLRLLYYTDKHALKLPQLTQQQAMSMLGEQIKIVPKIVVDPDTKPYIIISLDNFVPNPGQTTFRQITLSIDVFCAYDHWVLEDFKLRPYTIAGELDGMINNSFITGAGLADFMGAKQLVLNEHLGGCSLYYNLETFFDDHEPQVVNPERLGRVNDSGV
jgi:hypothetical protein